MFLLYCLYVSLPMYCCLLPVMRVALNSEEER